MAREKKKKIDFNEQDFSVSIGEAMGMAKKTEKPRLPGEPLKLPKEKDEPAPAASLESVRQLTLHRESSGRGGRIVTAVSVKPPLAPAAAEALARSMRKGLGCGSHVEGSRIILQGDIQERAEVWLRKQGAKRVVMGN